MDQRLSYEQLIGEKLQSLPIPDMADAIWARVEAQLDIDLPTDDGGGSDPSPQSPSGGGIFGWGLSIFVIALISLFIVYKNNSKNPDNLNTPVSNERLVNPAQKANGPPEEDIGGGKKESVNKGDLNNVVFPNAQQDSVVPQPLIVTTTNNGDTIKPINTETIAQVPVPKDTIPKKKGKGVGLKDEDYKIVPKDN